MGERLVGDDQRLVTNIILQANERGWGIAVGLVLALALFAATNFLVLQGPDPGPHLGLLRAYFPGYSVTFGGSLIGFAYAFVVGYVLGRAVVTIYNRLAVKM